jgi:N-acetylneuraminate synthase/N,N'-diacetyllegionaminate synthase
MQHINPINAAGRMIGHGHPCLIAAEIGINHNGDMALAHDTIDAAADAGVDAVKFQNYKTEDFLSDRSLMYEYISQGKTVTEPQYELFKRCELLSAQLAELSDHCGQRKVMFFSTPTSEDGIHDLQKIGVPLLKNGSDYLVHLPLIRAMARSGIPTVLSTGMATLGEIEDAVHAFRDAGGTSLILLHCTSSYPTPDVDVNLRKIPSLAEAFRCLVGFSDHTWGPTAAIGAIALGACFVEKHFTLDKNLPGPDHRFSSDPVELKALVEGIRRLEGALGEAVIGPTLSEAAGRREFRLSCVAARALEAGHQLAAADIVFRRPSSGIPPKLVETLHGKQLARKVEPGHVFTSKDFT